MSSPDTATGAVAISPSLLKHRAFLLFWGSRVFSALGFQASAVVIGWLIYERTGSAFALGFVGLAQFLPMLVLTFVIGTVADRYDRRRIVLVCQVIEAATLAAIALGLFSGTLGVASIYVAAAILGGARAFEGPTLAAILPGAVPPALLPRALALSSSAMQSATIFGPALGGLLYALDSTLPFAMAAFFLAAAALSIAVLRLQRTPPRREPLSFASFFGGLHFIRSRPIVLGTISLDLFAVLLGGVTALLPIFASDVLHVDSRGLGLLRAAPALGGLAMSLVLARFEMRRHIGRKMFAAVILFGVATIVFALSTSVTLSCLALLFLGAVDNVSVVIRNSLVQLATPDEMRGRVNAVNSLFIGASNQLGEFESGMVAGLIGAVPAAAVGGIGTIVVALLWMRLFPALRRADRFGE